MPKEIAENQLAPIEAKKEKKEAGVLGVSELTRETNKMLEDAKGSLKSLSQKSQDSLHDAIVKYFLTSADRYDKNGEKGLSRTEFETYKKDMLKEVGKIIERYDPSKETAEEREIAEKETHDSFDLILNANGLSLSEGTISAYVKKYLEVHETARVPISDITKKLASIAELLPDSDAEYRELKLLEAFGVLINGESVGTKLSDITQNILAVNATINSLQTQLQSEQKHLETLSKIDATTPLSEAVKLNDSWFVDAGATIDQDVYLIEKLSSSVERCGGKIAEMQAKIISNKQVLCLNFYNKAKAEDKDTDPILIAAFEELGDNIPPTLKSEVGAAKTRKVNNPKTSEFEKLFYQGKYEEALSLLVELNKGKDVVGQKGWAKFSENEVSGLYKDVTANPYGEKALESKSRLVPILKSKGFAGKKIQEGYIPLLQLSAEGQESVGGLNARGYLLAKQKEDGSLSVYVVNMDGLPVTAGSFTRDESQATEHIITQNGAKESAMSAQETQENFGKVVDKMPSFNSVKKASAIIGNKFAPLQKLFTAGMQGKKTPEFVSLAKGYARDIQGSNELSILRANMPQVKKDLALLKQMPSGFRDKFEKQIFDMEQLFSKIADIVDKGTIDYFCEKVLNPSFSEDTLTSWAMKELLVTVSAVIFAVTAVVLTVSTGGIGGMALGALVGAVGGVVGAEFGYVVSEKLGELKYGEGFSNKSTLGQYLSKEGVLDSETGRLKTVGKMDLAKVYGEQVAMGFITTFALLGLGTVAGRALSRFAEVNASSAGVPGSLAKLLSKIPKLKPQEINLASERGAKDLLKKLGEEYLEEFTEEGVESAAERIGPVTGFLASLYNCLNTSHVKYSLGKYKVVAESVTQTDSEVVSTFTFDSSKSSEISKSTEDMYRAQGFDVSRAPDGTITAVNKLTLKKGKNKGKEVKTTMIFKPTTESLPMREFIHEGFDAEGEGQVEKLYGLKRTGENQYQFNNLSPKGKLDLKTNLKKRGFIIEENADGSFEARKGEEVVEFERAGAAAESGDNSPNSPSPIPRNPNLARFAEAVRKFEEIKTPEGTISVENELVPLVLKPGTVCKFPSGLSFTVAKVQRTEERYSIHSSWVITDTLGAEHLWSDGIDAYVKVGAISDSSELRMYKDILLLKGENGGSLTVGGNPEVDMEPLISKISLLPSILGFHPPSNLSKTEKRELMVKIKETLTKQYKIIADLSRSVQAYLEQYPDASILELRDQFFTKELSDSLSPNQASRVLAEFQNATARISSVKKYSAKFKKNPQRAIETLLGLAEGSIKGKVDVMFRLGIIHFNCHDADDYELAYGHKDASSTGGFAIPIVKIAELNGAITFSKNTPSEEWMKTIIAHEHRHQLNLFTFHEFKEGKSHNPLHKAKDEIIAYLRGGSSLDITEGYLTDDNGVYDYFRDSKSAVMKNPDALAQVNEKWENHKKNIRRTIARLREAATDIDGTIDTKRLDIELLSVTPIQHWRFILKAEGEGMRSLENERRSVENATTLNDMLVDAGKTNPDFEKELRAKHNVDVLLQDPVVNRDKIKGLYWEIYREINPVIEI